MKPFHLKVIQTIKLHSLISKGDRILFGLSGGPDSICLFHVLKELTHYYQLEFLALHINYGMRKTATRDERYVRKSCKENNCGLYIYSVKKNELDYYSKNKISRNFKIKLPQEISQIKNFENRAREIRYYLLNYLSLKNNFNKIAIAHQADDQAETVLLNFLRGGGLKGIGAMNYKRGEIIRPLLNITKKEILNYLQKKQINYCIDESNYNPRYIRNRIRHKLIPVIEKDYNPQIIKTLLRNSQFYRDAYNYLARECQKKIKKNYQKNKSTITIPLKVITSSHLTIQNFLIKEIILQLIGDVKDLNAKQITDTCSYLKNPKNKKVFRELPTLTIRKNDDKVIFRIKK